MQPCTIAGARTLVYSPSLANGMSVRWASIRMLSTLFGWRLMKDRRGESSAGQIAPHNIERRKPARLVGSLAALLCYLLCATTAVSAKPESGQPDRANNAVGNVAGSMSSSHGHASVVHHLGLFAARDEANFFNARGPVTRAFYSPDSALVLNPVSSRRNDVDGSSHRHSNFNMSAISRSAQADSSKLNSESQISPAESIEKQEKALATLLKHWKRSSTDPDHMPEDIERMAEYFAATPDAYRLLMSLHKKNWRFRYSAEDFRTDIRGNAISVNAVTIYFDPRSAARLKNSSACEDDIGHCVASPADAFIHELIHAQIALLNTRDFLRQGVMNSVTYPHKHEREVIAKENRIYTAMSNLDSNSRPLRRKHTGSLVPANCVTCLGS